MTVAFVIAVCVLSGSGPFVCLDEGQSWEGTGKTVTRQDNGEVLVSLPEPTLLRVERRWDCDVADDNDACDGGDLSAIVWEAFREDGMSVDELFAIWEFVKRWGERHRDGRVVSE